MIREFTLLPGWAQILVIGTLLFVGYFWVSNLTQNLATSRRIPRLLHSKASILLLFGLLSMGIAYLMVNFMAGSPLGHMTQPPAWGFHGRAVFIILSVYLTRFLTQYFQP